MQNSAHMLGQGSWAKAAGPKQQAKQKPGPTTPGQKEKQHVHPRTPAPFINALYDHMRMTQAQACDLGIFALHILALRSHAHSRRTTPGRPTLPFMGPDHAPPPLCPLAHPHPSETPHTGLKYCGAGHAQAGYFPVGSAMLNRAALGWACWGHVHW